MSSDLIVAESDVASRDTEASTDMHCKLVHYNYVIKSHQVFFSVSPPPSHRPPSPLTVESLQCNLRVWVSLL